MIHVGTVLMMIAAVYAVVGNAWFITNRLKGKLSAAGGSITHIGFGLMLVGVLISGIKKRTISADMSGVLYSEFGEETARENVLLMKDQPVRMGDFMVTYLGDSVAGPNHYYMVNYNHIHGKDSFTLFPNAQISENQGLMPNPDTRHYLTYDVFTHVTSVPKEPEEESWETEKEVVVNLGDTVHTSRGILYFESVERGADDDRLKGIELLSAVIRVVDQGKTYEMRPVYALTRESYFSIRDENEDLGLRLNFEIRPTGDGETPKMFLEVSTRPRSQKYIVMKAIVFPFINLLWAGTIIMIVGFTVAMFHRRKKKTAK
jgi:cytochrome c-type biogenesis protein CcmF